MQNIIKEIKQNHKCVIFVEKNDKEMEVIWSWAMDYEDICFLCYNVEETVRSQLEKIAWEKYDTVYLVPFYRAEYIVR